MARIIVLHHGLMGFNSLQVGPVRVRYWDGIAGAIADAGYTVLTTRVHPTAGVRRRARQLSFELREELARLGGPGTKAVIITHSLGGLDARYMVSRLGMADYVEALVTISAPHHGSAYYDHLIAKLGSLGKIEILRNLFVDIRAFWEVTMAHSRRFNQEVPDAPGVRYYCVTAACEPERVPLFLQRPYRHILERQGENDGLVAAQSARWGTELGHWPVHHFHQINWKMQAISGPSTEDIRTRYLQLLSLLHADGVLEEPAEVTPQRILATGR